MAAKYTLTSADTQAVVQAAATLGIQPGDLITAIHYETAGTMNPGQVGGDNNHFIGLIQFGKKEQARYGYKLGMSFADQVKGPVVNYLRDRGVRPGMNYDQLYTAINYGNVKNGKVPYGYRDGSGRTLRENIAAAQRGRAAAVAQLNGAAPNGPQPSRTLKKGMEGMDVAGLQTRLQAAGLYNGPIDGRFGAGTAAAVRATERAANIHIDRGAAGPQVQRALAGVSVLGAGIGQPTGPIGPGISPQQYASMPNNARGAMFPSGGPVPPMPVGTFASNFPARPGVVGSNAAPFNSSGMNFRTVNRGYDPGPQPRAPADWSAVPTSPMGRIAINTRAPDSGMAALQAATASAARRAAPVPTAAQAWLSSATPAARAYAQQRATQSGMSVGQWVQSNIDAHAAASPNPPATLAGIASDSGRVTTADLPMNAAGRERVITGQPRVPPVMGLSIPAAWLHGPGIDTGVSRPAGTANAAHDLPTSFYNDYSGHGPGRSPSGPPSMDDPATLNSRLSSLLGYQPAGSRSGPSFGRPDTFYAGNGPGRSPSGPVSSPGSGGSFGSFWNSVMNMGGPSSSNANLPTRYAGPPRQPSYNPLSSANTGDNPSPTYRPMGAVVIPQSGIRLAANTPDVAQYIPRTAPQLARAAMTTGENFTDQRYDPLSSAPAPAPQGIAGVNFQGADDPVVDPPDLSGLGAGAADAMVSGTPQRRVMAAPRQLVQQRTPVINARRVIGSTLGSLLAGPLGGIVGGLLAGRRPPPVQQYGTNQSGFAPTGPGWSQPNFNPISGGSINPTMFNPATGQGVFMSSIGRPMPYSVNDNLYGGGSSLGGFHP